VPKPGGRVDVLEPPDLKDWWTSVGSQSDAEHASPEAASR
jgi:hypothetical protein